MKKQTALMLVIILAALAFFGCAEGAERVKTASEETPALAEEIVSLENQVIAAVKEKFGVELHPEVEHL